MKKIYIAFVLLFSVLSVYSQKGITTRPDKAFEAGKYYEAIDLYKLAFGKTKDKTLRGEITFKTAECYRMLKDFDQAELWYMKAIKKDFMGPVAILYLADAMRANGKFVEAKEQYGIYKKFVPDDIRAINGEKACDLAQEWIANPTRYKIENMYYFNSKESDYSPTYGSSNYKMILFTSSRESTNGDKISKVTGQKYTDIFKTRVDRKGKWSEPEPLGNDVNTEYDEGSPSTNKKCNTLYFTCFKEGEDGKMSCKIYEAKKDGIEWIDVKPVDIVSDSIVAGHPAISADEKTLIFVAQMKGGQGGKDLWKVTRSSDGGKWSEPVNLGSDINTAGDEMFPFIHEDGTLYFSSDGHLGMGGLDIFMAIEQSAGSWKVENMKVPLNSTADDFGITFEESMERGYFSSNRPGGKGDDDIYQFTLPPIEYKLIGTVYNKKSETIIAGADVTLIGSDGTNISKKSENDGTFTFKLSPNTDYRINVRRGGFLNAKGKETTKGAKTSKDFKMDVFMSPDDSRMDLAGIMYDLGKWSLRPESMVALEELVEILNDNPNITIEIGSHTDFRGSDESNASLSAKRAQSVVDFLITYGIDAERLSSKGYGESMPKEIDKALAKQYPFLREGDILNESFINRLNSDEKKDICHQINRRTDFGLTGRDYVPKIRRRK